jgi:hypothetical protein
MPSAPGIACVTDQCSTQTARVFTARRSSHCRPRKYLRNGRPAARDDRARNGEQERKAGDNDGWRSQHGATEEKSQTRYASALILRSVFRLEPLTNRAPTDACCVHRVARSALLARPSHSRQTVSSAAIMTGPMNSPINPNTCRPPKIPISATKNGNRAALPTSVGHTK